MNGRVPSKELKERLRIDYIISVLYSKTDCDGIMVWACVAKRKQ